MDKDMKVRNAGKYVATSGNISMGSDPIDFLQSLARYLLVLIALIALIALARPAQASGTVPVSPVWITEFTKWVDSGVLAPTYLTAVDACLSYLVLSRNFISPHVFEKFDGVACRWTVTVASVVTYTNLASGGTWLYATCPANSKGSAGVPTCTCNTGYQPDAAGTSCVPIPDTCKIPDLTPLTDPVAIEFDNNVGSRWRPKELTPDYQTKLKCVEDAIIAKGGTSEGTSAYRPEQYQRHLYEIIKTDVKLDKKYMKAHPECQARRAEITRKMGPALQGGHDLKRNQKVAKPGTSRHESRTAFDLTPSDVTKAQLAIIYKGCGVTNTAVSSEPWHTQ